MRAFLVIAVMIAVPSAASARDGTTARQTISPADKRACQDNRIIAAANGKSFSIRPLGDQPDARQLLAVVRIVDGCNKPTVINDRIGFSHR